MTVGNCRILAFCTFSFFCHGSWLMEGAAGQDITLKPLDHDAYDRWNTISRELLSEDGKWIMYTVQNGAIDGETSTHFFNPSNGKRYIVTRAAGAEFTYDSRYAIYRLMPEKQESTKGKSEKAKPKPKLQYLDLSSGKVTTIEGVRSFSTPEENGMWIACQLENANGPDELSVENQPSERYEVTPEGLQRLKKPLKLKSRKTLSQERGKSEILEHAEALKNAGPISESKQKISKPEKETTTDGDQEKKKKVLGTPLLLVDLTTGVQRTFPNVASYQFSKKGSYLAVITSVKQDAHSGPGKSKENRKNSQSLDVDGVHLVKLETLQRTTLLTGPGEYKSLAFSEHGTDIAFATNKDNYTDKEPTWSVFLAATRGGPAKRIAREGDAGIPNKWWISPQTSVQFSDDNARVYFDTAPIPEKVLGKRDGVETVTQEGDGTARKKAKLDLWHWKDPQLQPQQLLQAEAERKRRYRAAFVLKSDKVVQLENQAMPSVSIDYRSPATVAVANTNLAYRRTLSWDYPGFQDIYVVNLDTGSRARLAEKVKWNAAMSPLGKYITWFDAEKKQWYAQATRGSNTKPVLISRGIRHPLQDELHDTPNLARAYGSAGWLNKDEGFLIYDRYDLWQLDPSGKLPARCLTAGNGRKQEMRFRYARLDPRKLAIDAKKGLILTAFQTRTKASGYYSLQLGEGKRGKENARKPKLRQLLMLDERVSGLEKAKQSERVIFTRSSFRRCSDVWTSTLDFSELTRVSDINPQQDEYSWGNAELVHWRAKDGQNLDGILLKPDDFDPSRKYPMLVYFYERNSDNLHRYYTPAAGRSIVCHSFYVSRGYLVFIPDIPYKTGEPGPSAVNAILPGVEHLIDKGFVRKDRIGLQGHSWGGYQTAYLVTQTDMFACAESGAPVSNMTSAYGGIRWGSGMSRMFQYERTQSRIGEDLWSARDKYVANSPLFYADQIKTPLLILHNDEDGAVPWYQGIELFVALRRLGRPAWMLNYNGEPHWVMDDYNRRDFATRMQQFFDHYLQDAPEPEWMAVGIPAVKKGETYGLELLEPAESGAVETQ